MPKRGDHARAIILFRWRNDTAKPLAYRSISVHYHYQDLTPPDISPAARLRSRQLRTPTSNPLFGGGAKAIPGCHARKRRPVWRLGAPRPLHPNTVHPLPRHSKPKPGSTRRLRPAAGTMKRGAAHAQAKTTSAFSSSSASSRRRKICQTTTFPAQNKPASATSVTSSLRLYKPCASVAHRCADPNGSDAAASNRRRTSEGRAPGRRAGTITPGRHGSTRQQQHPPPFHPREEPRRTTSASGDPRGLRHLGGLEVREPAFQFLVGLGGLGGLARPSRRLPPPVASACGVMSASS